MLSLSALSRACGGRMRSVVAAAARRPSGTGPAQLAARAVSSLANPAPPVRDDKTGFSPPRIVPRRGRWLTLEPLENKGTAFPRDERERLSLRGLLPPRRLSMETQVKKNLDAIRSVSDPMDKFMLLSGLQDRNETLFFKVLIDHIEELGMYFSTKDRGHMGSMVYNWDSDDVQVIVVTDGSRILGLGDLGANGMGIPVGKLALYTAAGGIAPEKVLPVMLDAGTDNQELLDNPYYLGMTHPRLRGEEHRTLVAEFMQAVHNRWPRALVQFEDFATENAADILSRYRASHLCFNDDIQGTGSTTLAGILAAIKVQGEGKKLIDQKIVVVGAGSAGIGVATTLMQGMVHESNSHIKTADAQHQFYVLDDKGLLNSSREGLDGGQKFFARDDLPDKMQLLDVIKEVKPDILLGLTGVGGLFHEEHIREMAKHVKRPILFPLSNPTSRAECTAEQAFEWSDGRAVFASGSPFDPVNYKGELRYASQCNNMFIFPGVGLGATVIGARRITDRMFYRAAKALADCVSEEDLAAGRVFPAVSDIREVSKNVAVAVCKSALHDGIAGVSPPANLHKYVQDRMYEPQYRPLVVEREASR